MGEGKVSGKIAVSYAFGSVGEGLGYNVFYSFFVFFLVNIAGIDPVIAGTVSLLAVIWDGVTDPLIGYYSDHTQNPKGRRRPLILKGCILLGCASSLLFLNVELPGMVKVGYYVFINVLYWVGITASVIPHISLGAELTKDFDSRTRLRTFATFMMNVGMLIATGATLLIVGKFTAAFGSEKRGWSALGILYGVIIFLAYFLTYTLLKGKEPSNPNLRECGTGRKVSVKDFLLSYKEAVENVCLRKLLILTFLVNFVVGVASSLNIYMYSYAYGFSDAKASAMYTINSLGLLAFTALAGVLAQKFGKKQIMIIGTVVYGLSYLIVQIFPLNTATALANALLVAFGSAVFWTLIYAMSYDTTIIPMIKTSEEKDGLYSSAIGFVMKLGTSVGMWIVGLGLKSVGFQAELAIQSEATISGLRLLFSVLPGAALLIGAVVIMRYELSKDTYNHLVEIYNKKRSGEAYDTTAYRKLL